MNSTYADFISIADEYQRSNNLTPNFKEQFNNALTNAAGQFDIFSKSVNQFVNSFGEKVNKNTGVDLAEKIVEDLQPDSKLVKKAKKQVEDGLNAFNFIDKSQLDGIEKKYKSLLTKMVKSIDNVEKNINSDDQLKSTSLFGFLIPNKKYQIEYQKTLDVILKKLKIVAQKIPENTTSFINKKLENTATQIPNKPITQIPDVNIDKVPEMVVTEFGDKALNQLDKHIGKGNVEKLQDQQKTKKIITEKDDDDGFFAKIKKWITRIGAALLFGWMFKDELKEAWKILKPFLGELGGELEKFGINMWQGKDGKGGIKLSLNNMLDWLKDPKNWGTIGKIAVGTILADLVLHPEHISNLITSAAGCFSIVRSLISIGSTPFGAYLLGMIAAYGAGLLIADAVKKSSEARYEAEENSGNIINEKINNITKKANEEIQKIKESNIPQDEKNKQIKVVQDETAKEMVSRKAEMVQREVSEKEASKSALETISTTPIIGSGETPTAILIRKIREANSEKNVREKLIQQMGAPEARKKQVQGETEEFMNLSDKEFYEKAKKWNEIDIAARLILYKNYMMDGRSKGWRKDVRVVSRLEWLEQKFDESSKLNTTAKDAYSDFQHGIVVQRAGKTTFQKVDKTDHIFAAKKGELFDKSFKDISQGLQQVVLKLSEIKTTISQNNKGPQPGGVIPVPAPAGSPSNINMASYEGGVRSPMFDIIFNYRKDAYNRYLNLA